MYVYIRSESNLYTVGFYDPAGKWLPESDHPTEGDAAARVHYLNGGGGALPAEAIEREASWTLRDTIRGEVWGGAFRSREQAQRWRDNAQLPAHIQPARDGGEGGE
jgi:hypothetical protein